VSVSGDFHLPRSFGVKRFKGSYMRHCGKVGSEPSSVAEILSLSLPENQPQPFWSVMIPTYNPASDYLERTLKCVLAQDPGPAKMQIEVVDDCSPSGAPLDLVRRMAGNRVVLHREPKNLGLAGIWNRCIERAHGRWVHILHQDDLVMPGFYEKLLAGAASPTGPGLIFCRYAFIDEDGHWTGLSDVQARNAGILDQALELLVREQLLQTPAVVVKRSVYESLGGYRSDLCYALDWEMWCRIAHQYPVWFEPEVLACYRMHRSNTTHRLMLEGKDIEDAVKCIGIINNYLPDRAMAQVRRSSLKLAARFALENSLRLLRKKMIVSSIRQFRGALRCGVPLTVFGQVLAILYGVMMRLGKKIRF
jgi:glycosyltransferase involved in cell wall biosynthesis